MREAYQILYFAFMYFTWLPSLCLWLGCVHRFRTHRGLNFLVVGSVLQVGALVFHLSERKRLAGTPDLLYSWIAPAILALLGIMLSIIAIVRIFLQVTRDQKRPKQSAAANFNL